MQERHELEEILLSGLPGDERAHVQQIITEAAADQLRRKQEAGTEFSQERRGRWRRDASRN